jgi:hypothetical protein
MATYEVKIRLNGSVTKITILASDSNRARQFVRAQFAGSNMTIIDTRRIS